MELRDLDVNEQADAPESSTETTEPVETPAEAPVEQPEKAEETAQKTEPVESPEKEIAVPEGAEKPLAAKTQERIRNLALENKLLKEKVEKFSSQTSPELQKEEVNIEDLNKVINERAYQAAELLVAGKQVESEYQAQIQKWAEDFEQVKRDYPRLDPESPEFDAEFDSTLADLLRDENGYPRTDKLVSTVLKTFTKRESDLSSKAKEEGKSEANATLAKQIAEGAITPSSKTTPTSEELSDEELAELRIKNPKEWLKRL